MTSSPAPLSIIRSLAGKRLFITGATGFLGKVLVERILRAVPDIGRLSLLVRPGSETPAVERWRGEILGSPLFARLRALHATKLDSFLDQKVEIIEGDLSLERFGLPAEGYAELCARLDQVVACAATVTFDERLDRAVRLNTRGAVRCLDLARDAGKVPLTHVSTCFVSGRRGGQIDEQRIEPEAADFDLQETLGEIDATCNRLEASGASDATFVEAGAELARRYGWNDVYTLTKALGEGLLEKQMGEVPVAIFRPAIVSSAAHGPVPGWIEGVKVIDPLLVAYGRGLTPELPGDPETPLELIPVDFVANALLAVIADPPQQGIGFYQLGSRRNPITLAKVLDAARRGFAASPLYDESNRPIEPASPRFVPPAQFAQRLEAEEAKIARRHLLPMPPKRRRELRAATRRLEHFRRLLDVYKPYLSAGAAYDDPAIRQLWHRLEPDEQKLFPFDIESLDWSRYLAETHVPGLVRFALRAETGAPVAPRADRPTLDALGLANQAQTLFELFRAVAEAAPTTMALQTFRDGAWLRYTYRQALEASANLAARLSSDFGVGPGDRVVLWASGSPEWILTMLATHRLGATIVPLDPQWPADEVLAAADLVKARIVLAPPRLFAALGDAPLPTLVLAPPFVTEPGVGLLPGVELDAAHPETRSTDLASIIFTSGTTVAPKAVPLTHDNYLANVRDLVPLMKLSRERLLSVLPMHHVFEQMVGFWVPLTGASTFSYVAEIKPTEISWMMNTTRPTVLVAVPRLLELLHNGIRQSVSAGGLPLRTLFKILFFLSARKEGREGARLFKKVHQRFGGDLRRIATGGSALEPGLGRSFQLMGFQVAEGYGLTETSPVLTVNPWNGIRFGTVGKQLHSVEIEIRPPAETPAESTGGATAESTAGANGALAPGSGEIWVRGPNVMAGYFENPEATAEVFEDDFFNTGDIGFFDRDGYLHISGRSKDVIVTSAGKNIYPEEVEQRYRDLAGVQEMVILGLPDEGGGEKVTALVVPGAGAAEAELEGIRRQIDQRAPDIPTYQRIQRVEFWRGDLPKTTTMKVKRQKLRQAFLAGERGQAPAHPTTAPPAAASPDPAALAATELTDDQAWVVEALARLTRKRADTILASDRLADLGVDSLTRVELVAEIEDRLGQRIEDSRAAAWTHVSELLEVCSGTRP